MLRDRYDPINLFAMVPSLTMQMDPILAQMDRLLEDDRLFQTVKADLAQRFPRTRSTGRPSTPVEVLLRMLLLKHLYGWSYEQTEQFVADSLVLRQFCRVYAERVPDDTTLVRWANLIQPQTLHALLDHVIEMARQLKLTRGRKLRLDATVVETHIHHPSDSTLLYDGVRVVGRLLTRAKEIVQQASELPRRLFRNRTRSAKRQMKRIMQAARQRGSQAEAKMQTAYARLVDVAQATLRQARQVEAALKQEAKAAAGKLAQRLEPLVPRLEQFIDQTLRRVFAGEALPASEKVVSLFEPHTAIIRKGKPGKPVEFGRVVWLDEVEGGLVSRYAVLEGNPPEEAELMPSLAHHEHVFGKPPRLLAGDRGVYSPENERSASERGVKQVVLPKPGRVSKKRRAYEQQRWFRRGRNWRAGIEGRISGLKRRHKLERCRYHGHDGMERWVGWGVIAHDLRVMARAMAA
jgi:IS5 family transposase